MARLSLETALADFRSGRRKAEEIVANSLARWRACRGLGAVTWVDEAAALSAARQRDKDAAAGLPLGALAGLPFVAKDNIDTVGFPTTAGTAFLREFRPAADAAMVRAAVGLGGIVLGKTNMHELACGGTTNNPTYGTTRNPYACDCVPGGSSGGSGAAVAAGIAPLALGTDTAGSVRIPASFCGIAGLRPTVWSRTAKVYSSEGLLPFSDDLDTIGPLAGSVSDLVIFDAAVRGYLPGRPRACSELRLGLPIQYYWDLDPQVESVITTAVDRLKDAGATFVRVDVSEYVTSAADAFTVLAFGAGLREDFPAFLATRGMTFQEAVGGLRARDVVALVTKFAEDSTLVKRVEHARSVIREAAKAAYARVFRDNQLDAILFPTVPMLPPKIQEGGDDCDLSTTLRMVRHTMVTSLLGAPGLSLPAGLSESGLPVGLELDALPGSDSSLLAIGRAVERVLGPLSLPREASWPGLPPVDPR